MIHLTALISTLSSSGEEKIERVKNRDTPEIDYHSLGISPPKDEDIELDKEGNLILNDSDLDLVEMPLTIPISNLDSWVADFSGGSIVYTKSGLKYNVAEEFWEIDSFIEYTTISWFKKKYLSFLVFFRQIKNRIIKEEILDN